MSGGLHPAYRRLHEDAASLLTGWVAPSAEQDQRREDFLGHLRAHPDAMAKAGPPAHLTASCLVLDPDGSHVLLTLHRKARKWFQFGGHYEPGDAGVLAAATREAREESGLPGLQVRPELLDLDRHALVGSFGRCREHLDLRFGAVADRDGDHAVSEESLDVRWWPVDALPHEAGEELPRVIAAARESLGVS